VQLAVFFFTRGTTTTINHTKQRSPRFELKTKHPRHRENQLYSVVQAQCLRSCIEPPLGIKADFSLAPLFFCRAAPTIAFRPALPAEYLLIGFYKLYIYLFLVSMPGYNALESDPIREPGSHDRGGARERSKEKEK
jgi:hypothetical protein